jgi:tight adherence protein C
MRWMTEHGLRLLVLPGGVVAFALLVLLLWAERPGPPRVRDLVRRVPSHRTVGRPELLGRNVRRLLRLAPSPELDERLGQALMAASAVTFFGFGLRIGNPATLAPLGVVLGVAAWFRLALRDRRAAARRRLDITIGLPDAIDLLAVAVGAGLTVPQAVGAVGARLGGPHGMALQEVSRRLSLGAPRAEALEVLLDELGEPARPLVRALQGADRYGLPLAPTLERLSSEARARRRRQAEAEARRIPVRLLFPLVLCTLPAFALLTVVPLLAGSLGGLRPSNPSVDRNPPCCTSSPTSTSSSVPR